MSSLSQLQNTPQTPSESGETEKVFEAFDLYGIGVRGHRAETTPPPPDTPSPEGQFASEHAYPADETVKQLENSAENLNEVNPALWASDPSAIQRPALERHPSFCGKAARVLPKYLPTLPESIGEPVESILPGTHSGTGEDSSSDHEPTSSLSKDA